jgi:hypothetical protein
MKTHAFYVAAALELLICGVPTVNAQQVSTSAWSFMAQPVPASAWSVITRPVSVSVPIIVDIKELDRYGVGAYPCAKVLDGAELWLPFQVIDQLAVEAMVDEGALLQRPVWVMDGQKVIAEGRLVGECINQPLNITNLEYGFLLGFVSVEAADKEATLLKLEPSLDDLIRSQKNLRNLDDPKNWAGP